MPKGKPNEDLWLSFEKGPQNFMDQNFSHEKPLTCKAKLENEKDGVTVKQTLAERPEGISSSGEIRYWFNLKENSSFYGKVGTDSNLEIQYDHGVKRIKGINNNFYIGGIFNRTFTEKQTFLGVQLFDDEKWSLNSKLTYDYSSKAVQIDQKIKYLRKNLRINGFTSFDSMSRVLTRFGFLVGWIPEPESNCKWSSFLRIDYSSKSETSFFKTLFSNVTLNLIKTVSETQTIGFESKLSLFTDKKMIKELWLGSEWNLGDTTVKAKINSNLSHAISIRNKMSYGTYTFGLEATDLPDKPRFRFGLTLDLNL